MKGRVIKIILNVHINAMIMSFLTMVQALLIARGAAEPWTNALLAATAGIIFIGTPHAGSELADWSSILRHIAGVARYTNHDIVKMLQPGSEMLTALQQEFHVMLEARAGVATSKPKPRGRRIFLFFEGLRYLAVGPVVPRESAILARYPNQGIHANHTGMTRFADAQDHGYRNVSSQLGVWVREIEQESEAVLQQAASPERASISGLSAPCESHTTRTLLLMGPQNAGGSRIYSGKVNAENVQVVQGDITLRDVSFGRRTQ